MVQVVAVVAAVAVVVAGAALRRGLAAVLGAVAVQQGVVVVLPLVSVAVLLVVVLLLAGPLWGLSVARLVATAALEKRVETLASSGCLWASKLLWCLWRMLNEKHAVSKDVLIDGAGTHTLKGRIVSGWGG